MSNQQPDTPKKSGGKKKFIIIAVILLAVVAAGAFRIITNRTEDTGAVNSDVVNIRVAAAGVATLENTSPLTGRLAPVEEVTIYAKAMGEVRSVYMEMGQKVAKGAVLFELDKTQMTTSYNQAKAAYSDAQVNLERMETLYREGAVSLQQLEQIRTAHTIARESYAAASDGMSNYVVTAPISGYITSVNVSAGGLVSQSMPAATIANIDKLEIDTSVSEAIINKIKVGDRVEVIVSSASDASFPGTVTALSPAPAAGSLTYPMKVTLDNAGAEVKPGMFAEVIITSDRTADVIALPSDAVLIKSGKTVIAAVEDGKIVFKDVVVGVDNGTLAEIKSGVNAGDIVVVEGQYYLENDSEFQIID